MNAEPHTHVPMLHRLYEGIGDGPWMITYGDIRVSVCVEWRTPTERLIRKATAKAIRLHDAGSVKAAIAANHRLAMQRVAEGVASEWGNQPSP